MKTIDLLFITIFLVISGSFYIATLSPIFTGLLFLIFNAMYFVLLRKKFVNYLSLSSRVHTCYYFINSFLITLSVKDSYDDAFESATRLNDKKLNEQIEQLSNMTSYEKTKYLRNYFNLSIYKMFLNILDLHEDQGGSILNMSDNLIRECTRTEKVLNDTKGIGYKHLIEFVILWFMSIGILIFMRFGISDFYLTMLNNVTFIPMIFAYYCICLISIYLFMDTFTNLTIKEDKGV